MLTNNYIYILIILILLLIIIYITITGSDNTEQKKYYTNLIEKYHNKCKGNEYLNKVQKANCKDIENILKNVDSNDTAFDKLQQLTNGDKLFSKILKQSDGCSESSDDDY